MVKRRSPWRVLFAVPVAAAFAIGEPATLAAHALHTTMTEVVQEQAGLRLTIRAFADDFLVASTGQEAASAAAAPSPSDSAAFGYVNGVIRLTDEKGNALPLQWCGLRRTGELVWLCVRAPRAPTAGVLTLVNRLLVERHADQVNIVQTAFGTRRQSLMFTRRSDRKTLR